jgi:hypothetical protein
MLSDGALAIFAQAVSLSLAFATRAFAESQPVLNFPGDSLACHESSISPFRQVTTLGHLDLVCLCCRATEHVRCLYAPDAPAP